MSFEKFISLPDNNKLKEQGRNYEVFLKNISSSNVLKVFANSHEPIARIEMDIEKMNTFIEDKYITEKTIELFNRNEPLPKDFAEFLLTHSQYTRFLLLSGIYRNAGDVRYEMHNPITPQKLNLTEDRIVEVLGENSHEIDNIVEFIRNFRIKTSSNLDFLISRNKKVLPEIKKLLRRAEMQGLSGSSETPINITNIALLKKNYCEELNFLPLAFAVLNNNDVEKYSYSEEAMSQIINNGNGLLSFDVFRSGCDLSKLRIIPAGISKVIIESILEELSLNKKEFSEIDATSKINAILKKTKPLSADFLGRVDQMISSYNFSMPSVKENILSLETGFFDTHTVVSIMTNILDDVVDKPHMSYAQVGVLLKSLRKLKETGAFESQLYLIDFVVDTCIDRLEKFKTGVWSTPSFKSLPEYNALAYILTYSKGYSITGLSDEQLNKLISLEDTNINNLLFCTMPNQSLDKYKDTLHDIATADKKQYNNFYDELFEVKQYLIDSGIRLRPTSQPSVYTALMEYFIKTSNAKHYLRDGSIFDKAREPIIYHIFDNEDFEKTKQVSIELSNFLDNKTQKFSKSLINSGKRLCDVLTNTYKRINFANDSPFFKVDKSCIQNHTPLDTFKKITQEALMPYSRSVDFYNIKNEDIENFKDFILNYETLNNIKLTQLNSVLSLFYDDVSDYYSFDTLFSSRNEARKCFMCNIDKLLSFSKMFDSLVLEKTVLIEKEMENVDIKDR